MVAFVPAAAIAARTASPSSTCRSRGSVASTFAAGSSPALLSAPVSAPAPAAVAGLTMAAKREGVPLNLFRPKTPYNATVLYNGTLVGKDAPGETMHIVMNHDGNVPYLEGQSIGVMAPGVDAKGKPHKVRLYSIASTRHGDFGDGKTVSLSVKRLVYEDEEGKEVKGVCSNFLCDLQPGDKVAITGPVGTAMLMPEDPNATIIMLATGTGIAPFRTYMRRAFTENNPDFKFNGKMWLFLGVPTSSTLLYRTEFEDMMERHPDQLRCDWAISREQTDANGNKMYLQTRMKEYAQELYELVTGPAKAYIFLCGLKGMTAGIDEMFGELFEKDGLNWNEYRKAMKKEGRYEAEVY
ncbi:hypothetical protein I4F81_010213 [Pyropia yezoensis]|uniref:Uncharacterized protein n=1 Tax=Pyropia yezoensis TaxID=2788 RepID=A0ACC3CD10_PYRYE|nr:hypothetical protein I4F81_010213 [Neopyropia yezoensis]